MIVPSNLGSPSSWSLSVELPELDPLDDPDELLDDPPPPIHPAKKQPQKTISNIAAIFSIKLLVFFLVFPIRFPLICFF